MSPLRGLVDGEFDRLLHRFDTNYSYDTDPAGACFHFHFTQHSAFGVACPERSRRVLG
jgi:hypothetical protein